MTASNSTKNYQLLDMFNAIKCLFLVFLFAGLFACQHQPTTLHKPTIAYRDTATHLPQPQPLTAEERATAMQASNMAKIKQDKYLSALLFSGFEEIPPSTQEKNKPETPAPSPVVESEPAAIETSHLVGVEVWSIILGEEKIQLLAKAQRLGATLLPPPSEWHAWKMAMGGLDRDGLENANKLDTNAKKTVYFIAPPDFAKFKNGDHVIVEISSSGGVHIARYMK